MRILLITEVFPPRHGGSGRWFWEIYRRLDPATTTILAGEMEGAAEFDRSLVADRVRLDLFRAPLTFPSWGLLGRGGWVFYRRALCHVRKLIADRRPAQIHCGKALPEGLIGWWIQKTKGIPFFCYVHGEELNIAAGSRELRFLTRRVLRGADRVIANSRNTAELLRSEWGVLDERLTVLHPGVDIERFRPVARDPVLRQRLGWGDRPVILTVGRLQKRKGQDQLIRALPTMLASDPRLLYSIVGDGEQREELEALAKQLGVTDAVQFRGEVSDAEMLECYQQCDLFALPNRTVDGDFEGFGMVLLEAQACGRPVVAGRSGGTGETLIEGESGFLVDCTDPRRIADAIAGLLSRRGDLEKMGVAAREWVVSRFGWESLKEQAIETFAG